MGQSKTTREHDEIRRWAEERDGYPARVIGTGSGNDAGLLRIDFEEAEPDDRLERISWEEFFEKFDEKGLSFLYQDKTADGKVSRFFKFTNDGAATGQSKEGAKDHHTSR